MATPNIPFLTDATLLAILEGAVLALGQGASAPYASNVQPIDVLAANTNPFLNFNLPGGGTLTGHSDPNSQSIGSAINNLLGIFAPFISAYGLILPILGVIRGIIEIICALMNPFAVIGAVERLFNKWIPPFLSLFPPLAGVLLILNIIKIVIAIVLFTVTVIIPTIELIIVNIQEFASLRPNKAIKQQAIKDKITAIIAELKNQLAILGLALPVINLLQEILNLVGGKPCSGGQSKASQSQSSLVPGISLYNSNQDDSSCCDDNVCPPILKNPPNGLGVLEPTIPATGFTFKLITNDAFISELAPYFVNVAGQSNGAINDPLPPPTSISDGASLNVQLTTNRGLQITVPILGFTDNNENLILSTTLGNSFVGNVQWSIIPDYNILIFKNIISIGCNPSVAAVRDAVNNRFPDLQLSVIDKFPELSNFNTQYANYVNGINQAISSLNVVLPTPPFDPTNIVNNLQSIRNNILTNSDNLLNNLKSNLSNVIANSADNLNTGATFIVLPNSVKADGIATATISVIITDVTGTSLSANVPSDISFPVVFTSDFGNISNYSLNSTTGAITALISSNEIGQANIKATVNGIYLSDYDVNTQQQIISVRTVNFVGDVEMPARRFVSSDGSKFGNTNTKEPGK